MFRPFLATLSCEPTRWSSCILVRLALVRRALIVLALVLLVLGWLIVMPVLWLIRNFTFRPLLARHSHGGTGAGSVHSPRLAALASLSARS